MDVLDDTKRINWLKGALVSGVWSRETSSDPDNWSRFNPAWGQCAVTAALLYTFFGGRILKCTATTPDGDEISHCFNDIPGIGEVDLTKIQFPNGTTYSDPIERTWEYTLTTRTNDGKFLFEPKMLYQFGKLASEIAEAITLQNPDYGADMNKALGISQD